MKRDYERRLLAAYADRLARSADCQTPMAETVVKWLREQGGAIDVKLADENPTKDKRRARVRRASGTHSPALWRDVCATLAARQGEYATAPPDPFARNLDTLCNALGLDATDHRLFACVARYSISPRFERFYDLVIDHAMVDSFELAAQALDMPAAIVHHRLRSGALARCGMVDVDRAEKNYFAFRLPAHLVAALSPPNDGLADIERGLIGEPLAGHLTRDAFAHHGKEWDFVCALLAKTVDSRAKGVNILLYGPPGTGKTEFCKSLVRRRGLALHTIGETDAYGREPSREDRLNCLLLGQQICGRRPGTVLLVDEMEDFLVGGNYSVNGYLRAGSKVFMNRLLEQNPVPVLWTTNSIHAFDPAMLRRMSFAIEMTVPPARVRERIWQNLLDRNGIAAPVEDVARLARAYPGSPGAVANSVRASKLAGGTGDGLRLAVGSVGRAASHGSLDETTGTGDAAQFDEALTNADIDLAELTERLSAADAPRDLSLCLHGPSGTGKSAYVRRLAAAMGLDLHPVRASDIQSKWIGDSEKNIAAAFRHARNCGLFLLFDEADSLLYDRRGATHHFEVSQVNEMLTWMEVHPLPFACTTNLIEGIDLAALRRFTFKSRFDYLTPVQIAKAFERFFGLRAPDAALALRTLTPGDFATVARKRRYFDADAAATCRMLEQECSLKPGSAHAIGFHTRPAL